MKNWPGFVTIARTLPRRSCLAVLFLMLPGAGAIAAQPQIAVSSSEAELSTIAVPI